MVASIVQPRLEKLSFKQQSAVLAALRGPDKHSPETKRVVHLLRRAALVDDGTEESARFFGRKEKPRTSKDWEKTWKKLRAELESLPTHYVKHLVEGAEAVGRLEVPRKEDRVLFAIGTRIREKVL